MGLIQFDQRWTRQPQGSPLVNDATGLTVGLAHLIWAPQAKDVVTGRVATRNGVSIDVSSRGAGLTSALAATAADFGAFRVTTSDGAGTGDFAVCVVGNPVTSATRSIVTGGLSGVSPEPCFTFNGTAPDGNRSGGIAFIWGANGVRSTSTSIVDGQFHVFIVSRNSGVMNMYVDGINIAAATAGTVSSNINSANQSLRIGGYSAGSFGLNRAVIPLVAWWNRGLTAEQSSALSSNVWQLFAPKRIWVPVGVGGGTTYNFSASGSVALSGAAPLIRRRVFSPSGIVTFSGTSPFIFTGPVSYAFNTSGSVAFSGTAVLQRGRVFLPSGIVAFFGTSPFSSGASTSYTFNTSGSFTLSGTLRMARGRVLLPSGSVSFSGTALWQKGWVYPASGQVQFSGTANMYFTSGLASGLVDRMLKGLGK